MAYSIFKARAALLIDGRYFVDKQPGNRVCGRLDPVVIDAAYARDLVAIGAGRIEGEATAEDSAPNAAQDAPRKRGRPAKAKTDPAPADPAQAEQQPDGDAAEADEG